MKLILLLTIFVFACVNPKTLLKSALKDEQKQRYDKAEQKYLTIVVKYNTSEYVPEAMYRLGLIYKDVKKDYINAQMWFYKIINDYKDSNYYKLAQVGILESPDYIGAVDGNKVVLGDIESYGKNMRLVTEYKKLEPDLYQATYTLYAGQRIVKQYTKFYLKENFEIKEYDVNPKQQTVRQYTLLLKYPLKENISWDTQKENKNVIFVIKNVGVSLKLKDKEFNNCIKVVEQVKGEKGLRILYYAPNKGCIKITTSTVDRPDKEYTVMEMIQ